jgi:RNA methyltransferase, TrmH family
MPLKRYQKDFDHSYSFGVFPTLELLYARREVVQRVLIHSKGESNEGVAKLRTLCRQQRIEAVVDDKTIERLWPAENTYAVGVFAKYHDTLEAARNHIVLVNPSDMGNLGTILRTMAGFGVHDLALIRPAADIFDPKVIRASMGAVFRLRFAYFDHFETYRRNFSHRLYLLMTGGSVGLNQVAFQPPFALVFGNESSGLPDSYAGLGTAVRIHHGDAIDSLNLAVSVGIALYEATRGTENPL